MGIAYHLTASKNPCRTHNQPVDFEPINSHIAERKRYRAMMHIDIDIQDEQEAARVLSLLKREHVPHRVQQTPTLSEAEREAARERVMRGGSQTLDVEAMVAYNKQDRRMPFRDEE